MREADIAAAAADDDDDKTVWCGILNMRHLARSQNGQL